MEKHTTSSSNVDHIHYDEAARKMRVRFKDKNGKPASTYEAHGVTQADSDDFFAASSHGSHFSRELKGKYQWRKV
jgi:hypothetical protein